MGKSKSDLASIQQTLEKDEYGMFKENVDNFIDSIEDCEILEQ
jgi:hypothetical protein